MSSSLEDYLEAIYNVLAQTEVARSKDIADALAVAKPSVTSALKALSDKGLINYKPYGYVTLTDKGKKQAAIVARKHKILESFFADVLGADEKVAQEAACRAEHSLGPEIIARLVKFLGFVSSKNAEGESIAEQFTKFYNKVD